MKTPSHAPTLHTLSKTMPGAANFLAAHGVSAAAPLQHLEVESLLASAAAKQLPRATAEQLRAICRLLAQRDSSRQAPPPGHTAHIPVPIQTAEHSATLVTQSLVEASAPSKLSVLKGLLAESAPPPQTLVAPASSAGARLSAAEAWKRGANLAATSKPCTGGITALSQGSSGRFLVGGHGGDVVAWDGEDSSRLAPGFQFTPLVAAALELKSGAVVVQAGKNASCISEDGEVSVLTPAGCVVTSVIDVSTDNTAKVLLATEDGRIIAHDLASATQTPWAATFPGWRVSLTHLSPDVVVVGRYTGAHEIWAASGQKKIADVPSRPGAFPRHVVPLQNGTYAVAYSDGAIARFDSQTHQAVGVSLHHRQRVQAMVHVEDSVIALLGVDGLCSLWDTTTGAKLCDVNADARSADTLATTAAGQIVLGFPDGRVRMYAARQP